MALNVMLDIETLDTAASAVVLSIGAVTFSESLIIDTFYVDIDPEAQLAEGRTISIDTIKWWMKQSDEARKCVYDPRSVTHPIQALQLFDAWVYTNDSHSEVLVWGNGSDFDNAIVNDLYKTYKMKAPWDHRGNRCYRTLKHHATMLMGAEELKRKLVSPKLKHNALSDAEAQAENAMFMLKVIQNRQGNLF
jgi:hypothetical protein